MPEHSNTGLSLLHPPVPDWDPVPEIILPNSSNENYFTELIERRTVKRSHIKRLGERKEERKMV